MTSRPIQLRPTTLPGDHPEEVARLRAAYDEWWAQVSEPAQEYVEIPLGAEGGNPTRLTSFDLAPRRRPAEPVCDTGSRALPRLRR